MRQKGGIGRKSKDQVEEARQRFWTTYNRLNPEERKDMLTYVITSNVGWFYTFWKDGLLSNKDIVFQFDSNRESLENHFLTDE